MAKVLPLFAALGLMGEPVAGHSHMLPYPPTRAGKATKAEKAKRRMVRKSRRRNRSRK